MSQTLKEGGAMGKLRPGRWALRGLSVVGLLALWEWGGAIPVSLAFPRFSATVSAFWDMLVDGTFLAAYAEAVGYLERRIAFYAATR